MFVMDLKSKKQVNSYSRKNSLYMESEKKKSKKTKQAPTPPRTSPSETPRTSPSETPHTSPSETPSTSTPSTSTSYPIPPEYVVVGRLKSNHEEHDSGEEFESSREDLDSGESRPIKCERPIKRDEEFTLDVGLERLKSSFKKEMKVAFCHVSFLTFFLLIGIIFTMNCYFVSKYLPFYDETIKYKNPGTDINELINMNFPYTFETEKVYKYVKNIPTFISAIENVYNYMRAYTIMDIKTLIVVNNDFSLQSLGRLFNKTIDHNVVIAPRLFKLNDAIGYTIITSLGSIFILLLLAQQYMSNTSFRKVLLMHELNYVYMVKLFCSDVTLVVSFLFVTNIPAMYLSTFDITFFGFLLYQLYLTILHIPLIYIFANNTLGYAIYILILTYEFTITPLLPVSNLYMFDSGFLLKNLLVHRQTVNFTNIIPLLVYMLYTLYCHVTRDRKYPVGEISTVFLRSTNGNQIEVALSSQVTGKEIDTFFDQVMKKHIRITNKSGKDYQCTYSLRGFNSNLTCKQHLEVLELKSGFTMNGEIVAILNLPLDKTPTELSKGQKSKLAFIMTLYTRDLVLISGVLENMDESSLTDCLNILNQYNHILNMVDKKIGYYNYVCIDSLKTSWFERICTKVFGRENQVYDLFNSLV